MRRMLAFLVACVLGVVLSATHVDAASGPSGVPANLRLQKLGVGTSPAVGASLPTQIATLGTGDARVNFDGTTRSCISLGDTTFATALQRYWRMCSDDGSFTIDSEDASRVGLSNALTLTKNTSGVQTGATVQSLGIGTPALGATGGVYMLGSYPSISWQTTAAITANQKRWLGYVDDTNGSWCLATQTDAGSATAFPLCMARSATTATTATFAVPLVDVGGVVRATGTTAPASGVGVEIGYNSFGYVTSYSRSGSTYQPLELQGNPVRVAQNGGTTFTITRSAGARNNGVGTLSNQLNISSATHPAGGDYVYNISPVGFTATPVCVASVGNASAGTASTTNTTATSVEVFTYVATTGVQSDIAHTILCTGL